MAPREAQTHLIIQFLLEDEKEGQNRQLDDSWQADSHGDDDTFDPVVVADKLKKIGDELDRERFNETLRKLRKADSQKTMAEAFSQGVENLCRAMDSQNAEVAAEMQLIKVSVALGLYIKKEAPDLIRRLQGVMAEFLNRRVGSWVDQQGGWDIVADA